MRVERVPRSQGLRIRGDGYARAPTAGRSPSGPPQRAPRSRVLRRVSSPGDRRHNAHPAWIVTPRGGVPSDNSLLAQGARSRVRCSGSICPPPLQRAVSRTALGPVPGRLRADRKRLSAMPYHAALNRQGETVWKTWNIPLREEVILYLPRACASSFGRSFGLNLQATVHQGVTHDGTPCADRGYIERQP